MNVLLFGATGMVGQGVLRECLRDPGVARVLAVGRRATGQTHATRRDLGLPDRTDLAAVEPELSGFDACFFCLGVTSAENALLALLSRAAYMFRPGYIQPLHGAHSRTRWYRLVYAVVAPLYPALKALAPGAVTTTEQVGRAMIAVARRGFAKPVLEPRAINSL